MKTLNCIICGIKVQFDDWMTAAKAATKWDSIPHTTDRVCPECSSKVPEYIRNKKMKEVFDHCAAAAAQYGTSPDSLDWLIYIDSPGRRVSMAPDHGVGALGSNWLQASSYQAAVEFVIDAYVDGWEFGGAWTAPRF
jgi:DNA-directed RNA polymerase subunit RPC12/RpoP